MKPSICRPHWFPILWITDNLTSWIQQNICEIHSAYGKTFSFDAVCIGFIVSEKQSALVYEYCKEQRKNGTLVFVDPIMGDDGKRYNGITDESVMYMRKLCSTADVINVFKIEAEHVD